MGNEHLAIYFIDGEEYNVFGCWDKETPENEFDFYDVHDIDGTCINEGEPFWEFPSYAEVKEFINEVVNS